MTISSIDYDDKRIATYKIVESSVDKEIERVTIGGGIAAGGYEAYVSNVGHLTDYNYSGDKVEGKGRIVMVATSSSDESAAGDKLVFRLLFYTNDYAGQSGSDPLVNFLGVSAEATLELTEVTVQKDMFTFRLSNAVVFANDLGATYIKVFVCSLTASRTMRLKFFYV